MYDTAFLALVLLAFVIQLPFFIFLSYIVCAFYVGIGRQLESFRVSHLSVWSIVTFLCMISAATFNHEWGPLFYLFFSPVLYLAADRFSSKSLAHIVFCLRNLYWAFVVGIAIGIAVHWGESEPLGAILPWSSTNGLPSYLIVVQVAYSLAYFLYNNRLPVFSTVATLSVAVFGLGRGSIIIGSLVFFLSILLNLTVVKSLVDRKVALRLFLLIAPFLFLYVNQNFGAICSEINLLIEGSKFSSGVLDEHRGVIIDDYLGKIDAWAFLFGADYSGTSIVLRYGGNPHNSFIRAHSFYGLFGLVLIFAPILYIACVNKIVVHKVVAIVLISMVLLRAATEPILFPTTLDFFYFLYFFLFLRFAKSATRGGGCLWY